MTPSPERPPRRLDPCFCGSGRRYKDCHGSLVGGVGDPGVQQALALRDAGDLAGAEMSLEAILASDPGNPLALDGLGMVRHDQMRLGEAEELFRKALHASDSPHTHFHLSLVLLMQGRYAEGWPEFAWRTSIPGPANFANFPFGIARWKGEPVSGRRLLLHAEQGLGDTIQFVRFARQLASQGATLDLFCHAPLVGLLSRAPGLEAVTADLARRPTQDFHVPLADLPAHFLSNPRHSHWDGPYLSARAGTVDRWASVLASLARPRVGLVWRGNPLHVNDRNRSLTREQAQSLVVPGATFVNLQVPSGEPLSSVRELEPPIRDWDDTAAILEHLDLVVSVDTSTAHLAGAMAKPVLALIPHCPDWRWGIRGEKTPWYPTMRLLRQERRGDWRPAIESVREHIGSLT